MEETKKMKVAIYCRTATDNDKNQNLESQKEKLLHYAKQQGYTVVKTIAEKASGSNIDRSGIRTIYGLAEKHDIDAVLAVDYARLGRNSLDMINLEKTLKKWHVQLETLQSNQPSHFWDAKQRNNHRC